MQLYHKPHHLSKKHNRTTMTITNHNSNKSVIINNDATNNATNIVSYNTNQRLLSIAFISFTLFAIVQMIFSFIAQSQAMKGDSAAMLIDSLTYFLNYIAEYKKKHYIHITTATTSTNTTTAIANNDDINETNTNANNALITSAVASTALANSNSNNNDAVKNGNKISSNDNNDDSNNAYKNDIGNNENGNEIALSSKKQRRYFLLLEILPPIVSVVALLALTGFVVSRAIPVLLNESQRKQDEAAQDARNAPSSGSGPNITFMLTFSGINLVLDFVNAFCFAKANHFLGYRTAPRRYKKQSIQSLIPATTTANVVATVSNSNKSTNDHNDHSNTIYIANNYYNFNDSDKKDNDDLENQEGHNSSDGNSSSTNNSQYKSDSSNNHMTDDIINIAKDNDIDHDDNDDEDNDDDINLNMCSAYTHVFADTLRTIAVVMASIIAIEFPTTVSPQVADSAAALIVSVLIFSSTIPLLRAEYYSICEYYTLL